MLDAVRGGGMRPNPTHHASAQPHSLSADLLAGHVQLGNKPPHLRVEERRLQGSFRETSTMQTTRYVRIQRLPCAREEERFGGASRRFHNAVQRA